MADAGDQPEELSHEQKKEEEQAVIQQKIEETEAQIERLEMMDSGMKDMTLQELAVDIIQSLWLVKVLCVIIYTVRMLVFILQM